MFNTFDEPVMPAAVQTPEVLDAEPVADQPPAQQGEQAIARTAQTLVQRATDFQITTPAQFEEAGQMIDELKRAQKNVVSFFEPMAQAANRAWKAITERRAGLTDPLQHATNVLSNRYLDYDRKVKAEAERIRREEEKAAQEAERARLQAEAAARQQEADELAAAALAASSREEAQVLEAQAEQLQQEAATVRVEAATVQAPVLPVRPTTRTTAGPLPSSRANWTYALDDKMALIKAVAAGTVSAEALDANPVYLRARAKADKDTVTIPGVRLYDAGSVVASRAKR